MDEIDKSRVILEKERRELSTNAKVENFFKIKWVYLLITVVLSSYLLFQTGRSINITMQKLAIFDLAKVEVQQLRVKNIELIMLSERVVSEKYVESQARDKLNYAKEGETLFIIPDDLLEDERLTEYVQSFDPNNVEELEKADNLTIWIEFFKYGV